MNKKEFVKVSKIIFENILKMDDEKIQGIIDKKYIICVTEKREIKRDNGIKIKVSKEVKDISKKLNKNISRDKAHELLENKKMTVKALKELAVLNNVYINSRWKKAEIIEAIIEGTVGAELKRRVLRYDE